ncbi:SDR family NAD(P)-dependent oxidoreductase [Rhizomonospora bruguierae]|uniref:SDR family NAD(P)-dependent oxidoreductase n=1 Tax=Rhizomonospora bruguierae TaxID=1581705 RepID=UPI001BCCE5F4|nr:SDR family NAD(P)-dependent oxidoreductase [Micromonospora sp. NBRC 107566]
MSEASHGVDGLICLVTGAGSGIGAGVVRVFAGAGATLALNDIRPEGVARLASELRQPPPDRSLVGDVTDPGFAATMVSSIIERHGRIDVLVNNAALPEPVGPFLDRQPEEWARSLSSLHAALACTHAALPVMVRRGFGRIVSISSLGGQTGGSGMAVYCAAKGGLDAFTRSLAKEVAATGVTVNCVAPGAVDTPRMRERPLELLAQRAMAIPIGRMAIPEEIGSAVAYLASREAGYITGEVLNVDGGRP